MGLLRRTRVSWRKTRRKITIWGLEFFTVRQVHNSHFIDSRFMIWGLGFLQDFDVRCLWMNRRSKIAIGKREIKSSEGLKTSSQFASSLNIVLKMFQLTELCFIKCIGSRTISTVRLFLVRFGLSSRFSSVNSKTMPIPI